MFDSLWQFITKCDRYYYKMRQILLQNMTTILLRNAADVITKYDNNFITECGRCYYKMWQQFYYGMRQKFITNSVRFFFYKMQPFYYKMWQLFTNCDDFIIKCDSYYKMRRLLQITTLHNVWKFWTTYKKDFQTKPYILLTIGTWPTPDSKLIQTKFQKMISVNCVFLITYMPFVNVSSCSQV